MKPLNHKFPRQAGALALALLMAAGLVLPASAAGIAPSSSETYYVTLDCYGGLMDSSVVKTYRTRGSSTITDYGVYDRITNLTDSGQAAAADGKVTFQVADGTDTFCFQGDTARPFEEFPWTLSLSYALNGVPTPAEELAGKTGVVEITLDAVPNPGTSEYSRNNLVLTAMSIFNGDDILSLEAEGAQVQLIGNLYCVLYMVMPGEEQHFTIRVGTDDFSYSGMTLLAVPATLQQLEQIANLREAKEEVEDSYDAIQDSMDVILNSLDGMSGSLNTAASGLDKLNQARSTISSGKNQVYSSLDTALDATGPLTDSIAPMAGHLTTAQQALTDTTALLNGMSANLTGLKPEVENTRKLLKDLQADLDEVRDLLDDLEDRPDDFRRAARDLSDDFSRLGGSLDSLRKSLNAMRGQLSGLNGQLDSLEDSDQKHVTIHGKTVAQIEGLLAQANQLRAAYEASEYSGTVPFDQFITGYLMGQGMDQAAAAANAAALAGLWQQSQDADFQAQLDQAKQVNAVLEKFDLSVSQLKALVKTVDGSASPMLKQLESLCSALDSGHLSGDLERLADLSGDLMDDLDDHSGPLSSSLDILDRAAELAVRVSASAGTALDQVQALTDLMNTYEPETQKALEDAKTFAASASTGISALVDAARTTEALAKKSGQELDAGVKQSLSGLSAALRQSTKGLGQTGAIRDAADAIDSLITNQWDSHTGGDNNLLLMDAGARPQSLTDSRNQNIESIQYVIRTQEIKAEDGADAPEPAADRKANTGTFWSRVAAMFRDFWKALTGIFH